MRKQNIYFNAAAGTACCPRPYAFRVGEATKAGYFQTTPAMYNERALQTVP
jgi:hypothetical protein